ncbi:nuclease-related domain-containing protein [Blastococcus sp. SYSU D00922]
MLQTRWPDLAVVIVAFATSGALLAWVVRDSQFLVGLVLGVYVGMLMVLILVLLAIADGSALPRLGRAFEAMVGDELHKAPGVFAVISGISFEHRDIDHVVLAQSGCFAVEVKATFGRRNGLRDVPDLPGKLNQAREGARQIGKLLASRGVPLPVSPLLVLAGSGAPPWTGVERQGDVLVASLRRDATWRTLFADPGGHLEEAAARAAAEELRAYRDGRIEYELTKGR